MGLFVFLWRNLTRLFRRRGTDYLFAIPEANRMHFPTRTITVRIDENMIDDYALLLEGFTLLRKQLQSHGFTFVEMPRATAGQAPVAAQVILRFASAQFPIGSRYAGWTDTHPGVGSGNLILDNSAVTVRKDLGKKRTLAVIQHELIHAIGMVQAHSPDEDDMMYEGGVVFQRTDLSDRDIKTIEGIYEGVPTA